METTKLPFEEFPPVSKEQWLAQMEKDLREKPLTDLRWQLDEELEIDPFYHPADEEAARAPIAGGRLQNDWQTGELIEINDIVQANRELREGLEGGVDAPLLILYRQIGEAELEALFEGVEPAYISTHFTEYYAGKQPTVLLRRFYEFLRRRYADPSGIAGSLDYDPILDWSRPPYDELAETILFCRENLPRFRCLQVNGLRFHSGVENTGSELALLTAKGSAYLAQLAGRGVEPALANDFLQFTLSMSTSYFVEIAKLRAMKLLWANVLQSYGAPAAPLPPLVAHLARESQEDDQYTNMIKAGTQAMAAVIGGADRLYVRPADFQPLRPGTALTRRIARNVQHILRLESYLDRVIDPAAGSYYIEKLTDKLADQAWEQFKKIEKEEGFA